MSSQIHVALCISSAFYIYFIRLRQRDFCFSSAASELIVFVICVNLLRHTETGPSWYHHSGLQATCFVVVIEVPYVRSNGTGLMQLDWQHLQLACRNLVCAQVTESVIMLLKPSKLDYLLNRRVIQFDSCCFSGFALIQAAYPLSDTASY